jgi:hypothetical protein
MLAQDIILLKTGDDIQAIVQEIGVDIVKYKKYENAQGPVYSILKTEIFMIKYENGTKDTFEQTTPKPATVPPQRKAVENRTAPSQTRHQPQPEANSAAKTQPEANSAKPQPALPAQNGRNNAYQPPIPAGDKNVRFGIQVGAAIPNMSSVDFKPGRYFEDFNVLPRFGITGGVLLDIKVTEMFSLQSGLSFTMKGCIREGYTDLFSVDDQYEVKEAYVKEILDISYLELPVFFVYNLPVKKDYFNVGVGAYLAYGIAGKSKNHFSYNGESIDDEVMDSSLEYNLFSGERKRYNPLDYGLNGFVGFTFSSGIFAKGGYSHGLANISAYTETMEKNVKNYCFYFSVGMSF